MNGNNNSHSLNSNNNQISNFVKKLDEVTSVPGRTRGHKQRMYVGVARKKVRKNMFACRVVDMWNHLPISVVKSRTLNTFKNRLDRHWDKEKIKYNFEKSFNKMRSNAGYEGDHTKNEEGDPQDSDVSSSWSEIED